MENSGNLNSIMTRGECEKFINPSDNRGKIGKTDELLYIEHRH